MGSSSIQLRMGDMASDKVRLSTIRKRHLAMLALSILITLAPSARLHSEPIQKLTFDKTVSSSKKYLIKIKLDREVHGSVYRDLPFEPMTENRLPLSTNNHHYRVQPHKGNSWLEITIQENDTLYSIVRRLGLSVRDMFKILHLGTDTDALKKLRPGQKIRIHASGQKILELVHEQDTSRWLHVKKKNGKFTAVTSINGQKVNIVKKTYHPRPLFARNENYPELRKQRDSQLQKRLEATIKRLGLMGEIEKKKLAVALVDITDLHNPKLATLNGDEMMYAASLPKIAILLGAFVEIERGNMKLDEKTKQDLVQMIRFSSNEKASEILQRIGHQRLEEILMSDRYKLYNPLYNGGLWVGKAYGKTPAFERDPLHNLSHGATVFQTARFYYLLETGQLVSAELTATMKEILSHPGINHKFVKGLAASHPEAKIYRKSGSWRQWHADSALIEANGYKYIAVALAENPQGGRWLTRMISPLHDLIVPSTYAELTP